MQNDTCQNMLKRCVEQGFSLVSISTATQLPVDELQRILDNDNYILSNLNNLNYLMVFLMQLYYEKPTNSMYYRNMLESLINYFQISQDAISKYINVSIDELMTFESSPNKNHIERCIAHLFNTFIRNPHFSV